MVVTCRINAVKTRGHLFDVYPVPRPGSWSVPVYETGDPWVASLCERALQMEQWVRLDVRDDTLTHEIREARLEGV